MNYSDCTVGFARMDITPPLEIRLAGYFTRRVADGVLDPLQVSAVAFSQGECSALLMVCDLVNIRGEATFTWPTEIARHLGIPVQAVFLTHTHTHTGPEVGNDRGDKQYDDWLLRRLKDTAVMAMKDRKPVTDVRTAEGETSGLTFVRRFRARDGHVQTWASDRESLIGPAHQPDESLRLVRILRQGGEEIDLVNFQCHPDMIGGCKVSADYPGALCRKVERERPGVRCVFLQGAEGELVPWDMMKGGRPAETYPWCMTYGEKLADEVLKIYGQAVSTGGTGVGFGQDTVVCRTKRDPARLEESRRILELIEQDRKEEIGPKWTVTPRRAEAGVLLMLDRENIDEQAMPVSALTFCGVALVGIPGELFSQAGVSIRQRSPYKTTCVCSLTNGRVGYFATAEAYDQGGYEPSNSWFPKGIAEILRDAAVELLNRE